ncbi:MAG: lipid IV(A) 3-deoxy-D-manno-octulosonic acid transferase, partial [Steroidobacteraceae bacterium]
MRIAYRLLLWLLLPLLALHDGWRSLRHADERGRLAQRLGFAPHPGSRDTVWIHAVSVGEVQAAAALVRALRRAHPALPITVSTVTATGAARARALFGDLGIGHCYLPYDLPGAVRRFLDRVTPQAAIMLETELWPSLYAELARRHVPVVVGSARLSLRSVGRYRRLATLVRATLAGVTVGAQTATDAERFIAIGADPVRVHVTGNIKYDLEIPAAQVAAGQALRRDWGAERPVWIAGSTHEGEEAAALAAHAALRARQPNALLLLVPRHPQRFEAVSSLLHRRGTPFAQRSAAQLPQAADPVLLVDTVGELQMFYAAADIAFVGGSLVPVGGHSLLEPAALALPVLSGPHTHNGQETASLLQQAGALRIVRDADELARALLDWSAAPGAARAAGERGRAATAANRGAVERLLELVEPLLSRPEAASA